MAAPGKAGLEQDTEITVFIEGTGHLRVLPDDLTSGSFLVRDGYYWIVSSPMMTLPSDLLADKQRLAELLVETKAFQYSPDKPFQLVSGSTSEYYFDLKLLNGHPEGINAVAKVFYHLIKKFPAVRAVGGLESGSISIATAISQLSYFENQKDPSNPLIESFFVRKAAKKHGTRKLVEGRISSPVVIIDDVVTSGISAIAAIRAVQGKFDCKSLMSVIFRGSDQQRETIEREIQLQYIFHQDQFIKEFKDRL